MKELTGHIKQKALDLGFSKVGIARAEQLQEEGPRLNEWLRRGFHATMHWMNRKSAERVDPCLILHDVKSIVSVAMNYYTDFRHSEKAEAGKISRYAWGNDYHVLLKKRLEQLLSFITSMAPQAQGKIYIDTGPVMEKAWAGRSGIGWIGKHANLITKDYGSWVFLGEILLNLELEYDEPATDHCGSCTRCIDACPHAGHRRAVCP